MTSVSRLTADGTVKLSAFVVASKEMDGAAIAINEQRFAPNIMNVVSAGEFGISADGSVGEFLKFMPWHLDYLKKAMRRRSRWTACLQLRAPYRRRVQPASANSTFPMDDAGRTTQLGQSSLNNVARIESRLRPPGDQRRGAGRLDQPGAPQRVRALKPVVDWSTYHALNERDIRKMPNQWKNDAVWDSTHTSPVNKRFGSPSPLPRRRSPVGPRHPMALGRRPRQSVSRHHARRLIVPGEPQRQSPADESFVLRRDG